MNSLKPLLIIAIVGGIGYGVWGRLSRKPDVMPSGAADGWGSAPKVQLGEQGTNWSAAGPAAGPGLAPPAPPGAPAAPATVLASAGQPLPPAAPFGAAASSPGAAPPASGGDWRAGDAPAADAMPAGGGSGQYVVNPGSPAPPAAPEAAAPASYPAAVERARQDLDAGRLAEGLAQLSAWYDNPQLSQAEHQQLCGLLDQVAGTVIYSTRDLLEPYYEVQPGDRLEDVGQRFNVPWELLAKINGVQDPQALRPGERLKVVRGPFEAVISLEHRQLTLMLNGSYAGRFPIGIGHDNPPHEGQYTVLTKLVNPEYHVDGTQSIQGGDPANPLGNRWLGFGTAPTADEGFALHGTNDPANLGRPEQAGCVALSPRDVDDVYDILSIGSRITVHR